MLDAKQTVAANTDQAVYWNSAPGRKWIVKEFDGNPEDVAEIGRHVASEFRQYAVDGGIRIPVRLNFFDALKPS